MGLNQGFLENYVGYTETPDAVTRVNAIIDFWEDPCNAPWTVYIETLYPVVGELFLIIIDFDMLDLARDCLRPCVHPRRGRRKARGRRRSGFGGIPETSDLICKLVPGAKARRARQVGSARRGLWALDGFIQRGLWYWLLADIALDGFYLWTSLIRKSVFCQAENAAEMYALDPTPACIAFAGEWLEAGVFTEVRDPLGILNFGTVMSIPSGVWQLGYFADYGHGNPGAGQIQVRFTGPETHTSGVQTVPKESGFTLAHVVEVSTPGLYRIQHRLTGTLTCSGTSGVLWARRIGTLIG